MCNIYIAADVGLGSEREMARRGEEEYDEGEYSKYPNTEHGSCGRVSGWVSRADARHATANIGSAFRGCAGYYTSLETERGALLIIYLMGVIQSFLVSVLE